MLITAYRAEGNQIVYREGDYFECAEGWYDDEGNSYNLEKVVFTADDVMKEKVFHYRIPDEVKLKGNEALCFFSRGINFHVYSTSSEESPYYDSPELGSRELFYYDQEAANLSGTDIGLTIHAVPINISDKYNEISFVLTPTEYSAFILEMRIEDSTDYILSSVRSRMPRFIASVFIVFFGLATIIYAVFAVEKHRDLRTNGFYHSA